LEWQENKKISTGGKTGKKGRKSEELPSETYTKRVFSSVAAFSAPVSLLAFPNASLRLKPLPFLCSSAETQVETVLTFFRGFVKLKR
jgi:hypothetical protein